MPGSRSDPLIVLARIGAPNGVRGAVRVKLFGDDPASLTEFGALTRIDGRGHTRVLSIKPGKTPDLVVATLEGVETREAAAALTGVELGLPRGLLPETDDEDFYHADLIGLEAQLMNGERFGEIIAVHDFGAGDLLEVKPDRGGPGVLVPFTMAIVPAVDVAAGTVTLDPPDGLLDPPRKRKVKAGQGGEQGDDDG